MTIDETIQRYEDNAEYERTHGNLQGCLEFKQLANCLKELKQLKEQRRWIPCSERTPEKGGEYLLWGKISVFDEENYCFLGDYFEFEEKFGIEKSNYDPHTLGFLDTEIDEYYSVIAWMPLPDPYRQKVRAKNE